LLVLLQQTGYLRAFLPLNSSPESESEETQSGRNYLIVGNRGLGQAIGNR